MSKDRIYLSPPFMGGEELNEVLSAFSQNWIAPVGPHLKTFEEKVANYCECDFSVALSSGTAAIHLALIILGIKEGDEVLCSSFTFCGSSNPILYQKATPILIDSEKDTWNMCPETLEKAILERMDLGNKPKAIILVHLYGNPAKISEILQISEKYDIPVIEDAAEALGSSYNEQKLGSFGDIGILSFNGNKIITTGGGGMLLTNTKKYAEKARFLATQALDKVETPYYQHSEVGYNYRLSNISAAIGIGQMNILDKIIEKTRKINHWYREELLQSGIEFLDENKHTYSNYWLTTILVPEKKVVPIIKALESKNIESRHLWKPMHLQPLYKDFPFYPTGISEQLFKTGVCLPSGAGLSQKQVKNICDIVKEVL